MEKTGRSALKIIVAAVMLAACALPMAGCGSKTGAGGSVSGLIISEAVSSNKYSLIARDGSSPDYVEIYNGTGAEIDMEGFGFSDNALTPFKFTFPSLTIAADGYIVVYCTGTEDTANADGVMRTGFKLSSAGETISLSDPSGSALSIVELPMLEPDISYGFDGKGYSYFSTPTPGAENSGEHNSTGEFEAASSGASTLMINELMPQNDCSIADSTGERSAWAEIKNTGSEAVNLSGFGLTDDETQPKKWSFPDYTLEPGALAVVYLSGRSAPAESGELHAVFGLSEEDAGLYITNETGKTVDSMANAETNGMVSIGRSDSGETVYYPFSTPGRENGESRPTLAEAEAVLPGVYISEVKSTSEDKIDWIELYNASGSDVDLTGWGVSDTLDDIYRFKFEGAKIGAGQYLVVEGKGGGGSYVADFGIKKASEEVFLADQYGVVVDRLNGGWQSGDISRGRKTGGDASAYFFSASTKGAANSGDVYTTYAKDPVFSQAGGYVSSGTSIQLTAGEGDTIYYTTDGSRPDNNDQTYSGSITVTESCAIRAVAYSQGKLRSAVITENFLVETAHSIPVMCVSIAPYDFSSEEAGIYAKGAGYDTEDYDGSDYAHTNANYWKDWEKSANLEYFEADGTKGVGFDAGIRVFGQFSRELAQKSFSVHLRGKYGVNSVTYPFFRDSDITTFSSFILRQSGQDWDDTHLLDAFIHQSVKGEMSLDIMDCRPVALYINGDYWGVYFIREKENADYIASHYGVDKSEVNLVKGDKNVQAGKLDGWTEVREYIRSRVGDGGASNNIDTADSTDWLNERVDMVSQMEWTIVEAFFYNSDTGNVRDFKAGDGKWKKLLFDMDHAMKKEGYAYVNYLAEVMNDDGHGTGNNFQSHIFKAIKYNSTFRKQFIELYAKYLNSTLSTDRLCAIVDAMAGELRPEMARQCSRWGEPGSADEWEGNISALKDTIGKRRAAAIKEIKSLFGLSDSRISELFPNG